MRLLPKSACVFLFGLAAAQAEPFLPASPDVVVEQLPSSAGPADAELRRLRRQLAEQPDNLAIAVRVADELIKTARSQAEPRYYGYAEAALQPWWSLPKPPDEVLLPRATIRQHRHDFPGALADLRTLLTAQPAHFQARLTEAVILGVRGDYSTARRDCQLLTRLGNRLAAATCLATIESLTGQARQAYRYLDGILANSPAADPEQRVWSLTALAEIAERLGDNEAAERHFANALDLPQADVYLLSAYADFLLDRQRPIEVITLLQDRHRADGLILRLALAEQAVNSKGLPSHLAELEARILAYRQRGDAIHQREEALYTLHLLKQARPALALALANWQVQREPADARLVLEAALACGDKPAAKPVLDWLKANKLEDRRLQTLAKQLEPS